MLKYYDEFSQYIEDFGIEIENERELSANKMQCEAFSFGNNISTFFKALVKLKAAVKSFNELHPDANFVITDFTKVGKEPETVDFRFNIASATDAKAVKEKEDKIKGKDTLVKSKSKKAFKKNVETEIKAGKDPEQAVAIAYSVQKTADSYKEDIKAAKTPAELEKFYPIIGADKNLSESERKELSTLINYKLTQLKHTYEIAFDFVNKAGKDETRTVKRKANTQEAALEAAKKDAEIWTDKPKNFRVISVKDEVSAVDEYLERIAEALTIDELDVIIEEAANDDSIENDEYSALYGEALKEAHKLSDINVDDIFVQDELKAFSVGFLDRNKEAHHVIIEAVNCDDAKKTVLEKYAPFHIFECNEVLKGEDSACDTQNPDIDKEFIGKRPSEYRKATGRKTVSIWAENPGGGFGHKGSSIYGNTDLLIIKNIIPKGDYDVLELYWDDDYKPVKDGIDDIYEIIPEKGRFTVTKNGKFWETADSRSEAEEDIAEDKGAVKSEDAIDYEVRTTRFCPHCYGGIKSHGEPIKAHKIYVDEKDEYESTCDACGEAGFDEMYELEETVKDGFKYDPYYEEEYITSDVSGEVISGDAYVQTADFTVMTKSEMIDAVTKEYPEDIQAAIDDNADLEEVILYEPKKYGFVKMTEEEIFEERDKHGETYADYLHEKGAN